MKKYCAGHASYFCRRVTASCCFTDASRVTAVFFRHFFMRHHFFTSRVTYNFFSNALKFVFPWHKYTPLKTCFNANTDGRRTATFHPSLRSDSTLLLAVNLYPSPWRPSHPSWRSISTPPIDHIPPSSLRSTSTLPPGDHLTHPGGHPPPACGVSRGER